MSLPAGVPPTEENDSMGRRGGARVPSDARLSPEERAFDGGAGGTPLPIIFEEKKLSQRISLKLSISCWHSMAFQAGFKTGLPSKRQKPPKSMPHPK